MAKEDNDIEKVLKELETDFKRAENPELRYDALLSIQGLGVICRNYFFPYEYPCLISPVPTPSYEIFPEHYLSVLTNYLTEDSNTTVRGLAALSLGAWYGAQALPTLISTAVWTQTPSIVRYLAAKGLSYIGGPDAARALLHIIENGPVLNNGINIRASAIDALQHITPGYDYPGDCIVWWHPNFSNVPRDVIEGLLRLKDTLGIEINPNDKEYVTFQSKLVKEKQEETL